ncbi:MAG: glycosyltransferase family 39 protein [Clostridia bacterium]|nr:glycosyltransferase family 39 protein [Clostridia bacterium]
MKQTSNPIFQAITKSPITCVGLFCLLLAGVFTQNQEITFSVTAPLVLALVTLVTAAGSYPNIKAMATMVIAGVLTGIAGYFLTLLPLYLPLSIALTGFGILITVAVVLGLTKQLTAKRGVMLLLAAGFLLRLCYILYTTVGTRQHDVWSFSHGDFVLFTNQRHAQYIEYIATYLKLPHIDPATVGLSQLYHPPFHHLLAGLWLRLNTTLGIPYTAACENIQLLTLFYSTAIMIISYRILRLLGCKGLSLFLPLTLVVFHPTFILMAGSVNNDLLSITLALYAIYATLRWAKQPILKHILPIAFGVGLSMMTKLSGGMVAPAIALVFLWKWVEAIQQKDGSGKNLFFQFVAFGLICVPLGLWWQVKNMIVFGLPLTYVPALSPNSGQYIGDYTLTQRLFEIPRESLQEIFMVWESQGIHADYNEYNLLLALLKSSVFGEFTLFNSSSALGVHTIGIYCSKLLFYTNCGLVACSLWAGGAVLVKEKNRIKPAVWLLTLVWVVLLLSYIQFCFTYPQTCTQNFRYAVPTLITGCGFLGLWLKQTKNRFLPTVATALTITFALSSAVCYTLLGLV